MRVTGYEHSGIKLIYGKVYQEIGNVIFNMSAIGDKKTLQLSSKLVYKAVDET